MDIRKKIVGFLLLSFFIYLFYTALSSDDFKDYRDMGVITEAKIIKVDYDYKGRCQIKYTFVVNNTEITDRGVFSGLKLSIKDTLIGMYIPVIYIKATPTKNQLLVSENFYKKLKIPMPDSLIWLKKWVK